MATLTDFMDRIAQSEDFELGDLEARVGEEIATKSGATRGMVTGMPALAVQRIPLGVEKLHHGMQSAVDWLARRIREGGASVFKITVRRQPGSLVMVAEWPRSTPAISDKPIARGRPPFAGMPQAALR